MEDILDFITGYGLVQGSFTILAIAIIFKIVRRVVPWVYGKIRDRYTISLNMQEPLIIQWVNEWLANHEYSKKCRKFNVRLSRNHWEDIPAKDKVLFPPDVGTHIIFTSGRFFWISIESPESKVKRGETNQASSESKFEITIRTYSSDTDFLKKWMVDEIVSVYGKSDVEIENTIDTYFSTDWAEWSAIKHLTKRDLDSIILDESIKGKIVNDISNFREKKQWFIDMGIPYRRGYLLHGPPGCGKTSLAKALASYFDMNFYIMNFSSKDLNDNKLMEMMHTVEENSVILIEDIDSAFELREAKPEVGITFSGLLNAIDGAASSEDRIMIITTNHLDKLDPALIRPGRMDFTVRLEESKDVQIKEMFDKFYPNETVLSDLLFQGAKKQNMKIAPAKLQNIFIQHQEEPSVAVEKILHISKGGENN